jgi:hypothetical protein
MALLMYRGVGPAEIPKSSLSIIAYSISIFTPDLSILEIDVVMFI